MTEYALYKGEDIIGIGTAKELAEKLGIKPETIRFYATPTQKRRAAAAADPENQMIAVKIDENDDEEGIES